jgi:hypothetical protein
MLRKDNFVWTEQAKLAFQRLKDLLSSTPVLALPDFSKVFVVEVDASGWGIGAVLMQDNHPIAYISRILNMQQQSLSTYEKELLAVVFAVQRWRHYLLNRHFLVRTDHYSLKYILDQRWTTDFQQKWLGKLMEFDFSIEYRKGQDNVVADALSRIEEVERCTITTLHIQSDLLNKIHLSWTADVNLQKLIQEVQQHSTAHKHYKWQNGELRRKGKLVVGNDAALRKELLQWLHSSATGGHSGISATMQRVKAVVYWKGLINDVKQFVQHCSICQQCKYSTTASPGLLQPLPVPEHVWQHITMDFIEGLPNSYGKQVIYVVVDRLSKAAHFMALSHPYSARDVAQSFLDNVFKLHGLPATIPSDRDSVCKSILAGSYVFPRGASPTLNQLPSSN